MSLAEQEFVALRHTIAQRGTVRMAVLPVCVIAWAVVAVLLVLSETSPLAFVFPLLVLAAGFEAVHALHAGVERIGRYLQVRYERALDGPRWECTAMAVGPALPGGGVDPLFTTLFVAALMANFAASVFASSRAAPVALVGALHALALLRVAGARRAAARQRAAELARMSEVLEKSVRESVDASANAAGAGAKPPQ